jgi:hypothetical protein
METPKCRILNIADEWLGSMVYVAAPATGAVVAMMSRAVPNGRSDL